MILKSITRVLSEEEIAFNEEKIDTVILLGEAIKIRESMDENKHFQIKPYLAKNFFISKEIKDASNIAVIINLKDTYSFCKWVVKRLQKLFRKNTNTRVQYFIISEDNERVDELKNCIQAIHIENKEERYTFIYDTVCDFLDKKFSEYNYCDFQCDKCVASRNNSTVFEKMGCCYSFEYTRSYSPKLVENIQLCKFLKDKKCTTKNISCKLHTCTYLRKKGIKFSVHKMLLLSCFFNLKELDVIQLNFFKSREEVLKKLLETNHDTYLWYLMRKKFLIK